MKTQGQRAGERPGSNRADDNDSEDQIGNAAHEI